MLNDMYIIPTTHVLWDLSLFPFKKYLVSVATQSWECVRMKTHTPELGFPKLHRAILRVKTPCIEKFFVLLESYWSAYV
jgi:hypothetical protein